MKVIVVAIFALAIITVGANVILRELNFSAQESATGASTRIDG